MICNNYRMIAERIRKMGKRLTKQRMLVYSLLMSLSKPATVHQIHSSLIKRKEKIDLVSIYRNLDFLEKAEMVCQCDFGDGTKRYEILDVKNHHHHIICRNCGRIENISMDEKKLVKKVSDKTGFLIERHILEFFGLCPKCLKI